MTFRFRALVEDRSQEHMLRGLLDRGREGARLHVEPYPGGAGSGEQHVRLNFAALVKDLRTKRNQRGLWGLVVIDGDTRGLSARIQALLETLETASMAPLSSSDQVLVMVPTRNVETWAWRLLGNAVDETTDYKQRVTQPLRALFKQHWLPEQDGEPSSLKAGRLEWARLDR